MQECVALGKSLALIPNVKKICCRRNLAFECLPTCFMVGPVDWLIGGAVALSQVWLLA